MKGFKFGFMVKSAKFLIDLENMPVVFIAKPYKAFIWAVLKLCMIFSFLVLLSFTPLFSLFLRPAYIVVFYFTYIFIKFCSKFGYKKIMIAVIFILLYSLCYIGTTQLRNFIAILYLRE